MTEQSAHSKAVIALGKKLVAELGLDNSVDTLGRWMAHYIAQLLQEAESATDDKRSANNSELRDAILALWAHRFELSAGKGPFGDIEPILRALASLDPASRSFRHFSPSQAPDTQRGESKETENWVELAKGLDYISKILIAYCLASAADKAVDKSAEWIKLAKEAGADDSFEFLVIKFVKDESDLMKESDPNSKQRRILADRKKKLEAFLSAASILANDIDSRLEALSPIEGESDETPP